MKHMHFSALDILLPSKVDASFFFCFGVAAVLFSMPLSQLATATNIFWELCKNKGFFVAAPRRRMENNLDSSH